MNRRQKGLVWTLIFTGLFALSQDYLFVQWPSGTTLFGFPSWLYWYFFIQIALVAAIWRFSRKYWHD